MTSIRDTVLNVRNTHGKADYIKLFGSDSSKIDALVQIVLDLEDYPYKEYASYMMTHMAKMDEFDFQPYYNKLVDLLFQTDNQTVLRNITNVIHHLTVTNYRESEFIDLLISFIQDASNKVALHVYSMYVLVQFVQRYPELKEEISEIIELNSQEKTPAWKIAKRNYYAWTK